MNIDYLRRRVEKLEGRLLGERVIVVIVPPGQEGDKDALLQTRIKDDNLDCVRDTDTVIFVNKSGKGARAD